MLNVCYFVTGPTAGGKTTLVDALGRLGWSTLHTGDMLRARNIYASAGESAVSPKSADILVDEWVDKVLTPATESSNPRLVAIESCPRNEGQLKYMDLARDRGYIPIILFLDADKRIRFDRMTGRDMAVVHGRREVDIRKFQEESDSEPWGFLGMYMRGSYLTSTCLYSENTREPTPVYRIDTTHKNIGSYEYPLSAVIGIDLIMTAGVNYFNKIKLGKMESHTSISPARMVARCIEELQEFHVATHKVHKQEELIDSLWFLLLAMNAEGMSSETIVKRFTQKYNINCNRQMTGTKPHFDVLQ